MAARAMQSVMKAWQCVGYDPDAEKAAKAMVCSDTVAVPTEGHGQALVQVHFAAADPVDWKMLTGAYQKRFPIHDFPFVPGFDVAGEVVALGEGCTKLKVGDRVVLCLGLLESCRKDATFGPAGAFAEYCVCPEEQISVVPPDVPLAKVAGLPLAGLTAYQALFTGHNTSTVEEPLGTITEGSKVLVLGGDRGVGHLALQMARLKGAKVATTVPPSKIAWMEALGAETIINFREQDWVESLKNQEFDLILDNVEWAASAEEFDKAAEVLRPGGQYISTSLLDLFERDSTSERQGRFFKSMVPKADSEDLDVLLSWVASGDLEVFVDQVCPFTEARHALHASVVGNCRGKVVLCQCGVSSCARVVPADTKAAQAGA